MRTGRKMRTENNEICQNMGPCNNIVQNLCNEDKIIAQLAAIRSLPILRTNGTLGLLATGTSIHTCTGGVRTVVDYGYCMYKYHKIMEVHLSSSISSISWASFFP